MAGKIYVTDIHKIEDKVYDLKLNGKYCRVKLDDNIHPYSCEGCKLSGKSCDIPKYNDDGRLVKLCELLTNSYLYKVTSLIHYSLIYISKIRNGK